MAEMEVLSAVCCPLSAVRCLLSAASDSLFQLKNNVIISLHTTLKTMMIARNNSTRFFNGNRFCVKLVKAKLHEIDPGSVSETVLSIGSLVNVAFVRKKCITEEQIKNRRAFMMNLLSLNTAINAFIADFPG